MAEAEVAMYRANLAASRTRGPNGPLRPPRQPRPAAGQRSKQGNASSMSVVNIPFGAAYTVRQSAQQKASIRVKASEQIGTFTMIPGQAPGDVVAFLLNPQELPNTRLNSIARNYQKFKFRKAELRIVSTLSTSTSGQIITGYTNSAEQTINPGPSAAAETYALPGAAYQSLYTPSVTRGQLDQRTPAQFIKTTGGDPNTTIQGKFFVTISQQVTTAAAVTFPVLLDYDVELSGAAIQNTQGDIPVQIWPSVRLTGRGANGDMAITSNETPGIDLPSVPTNVLMQFNPSIEVDLSNGAEDLGVAELNYVAYFGASNWRFFKSVGDFESGSPILYVGVTSDSGSPNQQLPRSTVQRADTGN